MFDCTTLAKKKNHPRDSRREERCSTCDIMLDHARSAQGKSRGQSRIGLALRWSRLIEHDITRGTAFFSPRISMMVLFFGQGSKFEYFPHVVVSSIQSVATRVVLPATVFIDVGTDFTIPCNTSGSPVATNKTWVQLEPNNNTVRIARDFLSFQGAQSTDSGRYYCFADNGLTHDLQSTEVTVSCE